MSFDKDKAPQQSNAIRMNLANAPIVELANKLVLQSPNLSVIPDNDDYPWFIRHFQSQLQKMEERGELILPNLHLDNENICIFSDYGGDQGGSPYLVYSFLICSGDQLIPFEKTMQLVRERHGLNNPLREFQFKRFNSGPIRRALPAYLTCLSNLVNGLLLTVVVEKSIPSLFGSDKKSTEKFIANTLDEYGLGGWSSYAAEKILRVTHFISYLVALLSKPNQRIFWMTDHDEIAPSPEKHQTTLEIFAGLVGHYCKHSFVEIAGAAPFAEKTPFFLDLLSAPDVVAGSVEHYFSREKNGNKDTVGKEGVVHVLKWLCGQGIALKRHVIRISNKDGMLNCGRIQFSLKELDPNITIAPVRIRRKNK